MVALPKPDVILTHESDLDGFLSGLLLRKLARHLFETDVPLQAYHNHNWRQRSLPETSDVRAAAGQAELGDRRSS